jgi:MFS family permease
MTTPVRAGVEEDDQATRTLASRAAPPWGPRERARALVFWFGGITAGLAITGVIFALLVGSNQIAREVGELIGIALPAIAVLIGAGVGVYGSFVERQAREQKIEEVEQRLRVHPEKPQLAWDLARTKLENYLDRNLSQVRSIYWLTLIVMAFGFGFVMYGLFQASQNPEKLPVSIVASASGVLITFIGGSFLLIYRSILAQSKEYVTVLERINAVGMAVQVISSIPEASVELRSQTTAELAKLLLSLYGISPLHRDRAGQLPR